MPVSFEPSVAPAPPEARASVRSLSVIIPCFNEEHRLPGTLRALTGFLGAPGYDAEIIVVDDGSRDRTTEVALGFRDSFPALRVIRHASNTGKGFAVIRGMLEARGDAVLFSDADLSTPIEDLELLWPWYDRGCDVVIASRQAPRAQILQRQPPLRVLMGKIFNTLVGLFGVRGFRDTQCGFKLFRRDAARRIFSSIRTYGFAFDVEALMRARQFQLDIAEVGVHWVDSPSSRIRPVRDSARMLVELLRMRGIL